MNESIYKIKKRLQSLRDTKLKVEMELSNIIKLKKNDDKTVIKIYDMYVELDNIEDEIKLLEKQEKSLDEDER